MNKFFACMAAVAVMTFATADADAQFYRYGGSRSSFGVGGFGGGFGPSFGRSFGGGFGRSSFGRGVNINIGGFRPGGFGRGGFGGGGFYGGGVPVYRRPVVYSRPVYRSSYGGGYGRSGCGGW